MQNQRKYFNSKRNLISLFAGILMIGLLVIPVTAQAGVDQWLAFGTDTKVEDPEVVLISASSEKIEIQALIPGAHLGETSISGQTYLTLSGEGYDSTSLIGAPALPVLRRMIEVPLGAKVSLEQVEAKSQTISLQGLGLQGTIAAVQPSQPKCGEPIPIVSPSAEHYGDAFYPVENLAITDDYIVRGHRIVVVEIRPVRYNAALAELEVSSEISFRLDLIGSDMTLTSSEADRLNSAPFNSLLQPIVLNYNQGRPVSVPNTAERYLIITADPFETGLADFVALKESQGFSVAIANLTTVGGNTTAAIKSYIKAQYLGATPPDYV